MADAPEVISEFYPEHSDRLQQAIEALHALPSLNADLERVVERLDTKTREPSNLRGHSEWESVTFDSNRGLGPALLGHPLGPSDASACPRLPEVDTTLAQLRIAYSARIIGEPGAGKSICSYQIAKELTVEGFEVLRLLNPMVSEVTLGAASPGRSRLYLIDDAHLLNPHLLSRLESQAESTRMVLSTHNALAHVSHRGAITLDAKRAVTTIAAALRVNIRETLEAVRAADNHVGERMLDADLGDRIDHAENVAERPWQFCFVLGGGWHRAKQATDSARAAKADLVLAAVAIRQLASRDARASALEIAELCKLAEIDATSVDRGLNWLEKQRLVISAADCRTPHQRFASVVLHRILEGQNKDGRAKVALMIEGVLCAREFPIAGLRLLVHELRFGSGNYRWTRLLGQTAVRTAVARCWSAEGSDRGFACLALSDLWDFVEGGAKAVVDPHSAMLADWISNPADGAFGFGHILNGLAQQDRSVAEKVVAASDPISIASAYSEANRDTAYGLADLMRSVAYVKVDDFNSKVLAAIDRNKLRELAQHDSFLEAASVFSRFCASVNWWDESLALEMAELFIPTAQQLLRDQPIEGFHQISYDLLTTVLRVFDVLHVYVGKLKPNRRQWMIARRMCSKIGPKRVAENLSALRPRHFQTAGFFLHFLSQASPSKYDAVLRKLDWEKLDLVVAEDWANMPHETEVLLSTLYSRPTTRHLVQKFISERAKRIVHFPPRIVLMVPDVGVTHLADGGSIRLVHFEHLDWYFGGFALAIVAEKRPELVEKAVAPYVDAIARALMNYCRDFTGPAEGFVRTIIEYAPVAWREVLTRLDPDAAEKSFADCLNGDSDHRRTAASVIESALKLAGSLGDMARRLRSRFPSKSAAPTDPRRFSKSNRQVRRKRSR